MPEPASPTLLVLADNLERLRSTHATLNTQSAIGRAAKVDQKTVGRILNKAHEPQLNVVAKLAKAFGLDPWQMLVPNLDTENLPVLASADERELYGRLREIITKQADQTMTARQRISAKLPQHLGPPIQETYDDHQIPNEKTKGR